MDYFVLDMQKKTVEMYDTRLNDSFVDGLKDIESIDVVKDDEEKGKRIITIRKSKEEETIIIEIDRDNQITRYKNNLITEIGDYFFTRSKGLRELEIENVKRIGKNCLFFNETLSILHSSKVEETGDGFLYYNKELTKLLFPNLKIAENYFVPNNADIHELYVPKLESTDYYFLTDSTDIQKLTILYDSGAAYLIDDVKKVGGEVTIVNAKGQVITQELIKENGADAEEER